VGTVECHCWIKVFAPFLTQVVFNEEHSAIGLQVLRPLIGVIPEALVNTVIYYLRQGILLASYLVSSMGYFVLSILYSITYSSYSCCFFRICMYV